MTDRQLSVATDTPVSSQWAVFGRKEPGTRDSRGEVACPQPADLFGFPSHQGPSLAILPTNPWLFDPLTSISQRDKWCSREPWALRGPGRQLGGNQMETHFHQELGGGRWLSWRPS